MVPRVGASGGGVGGSGAGGAEWSRGGGPGGGGGGGGGPGGRNGGGGGVPAPRGARLASGKSVRWCPAGAVGCSRSVVGRRGDRGPSRGEGGWGPDRSSRGEGGSNG